MPGPGEPTPVLMLAPGKFLEALASGRAAVEVRHGGLSAFRAGWGFPPRRVYSSIVYLVLKGGIRVRPAGRGEVQLGPGSLLWLAPGVEHSMALDEPGRGVVTWHLRLTVREGGALIHPEGELRAPSDLRELGGRIAELVRASRDLSTVSEPPVPKRRISTLPEPAGTDESFGLREARLRAVAFLFAYDVLGDGRAPDPRRLTPGQWEQLRRFLDERLGQRPVPAELAAHLGLSPVYFARLFRRTAGLSPRVYLVREKMRRAAATLAEGGGSVEAAARGLGYEDLSLFSRQFKASLGVTPREFRKRWC